MTYPIRKRLLMLFAVLGLGAVLPALTGCMAVMNAIPLYGQDVNLTNINYAAADVLISRVQNRLNKRQPIYQGRLISRKQEFRGRDIVFPATVMDQVATRFVQLGFNVQNQTFDDAAAPPQAPDRPGLAPGAAPRTGIVLTGSYSPAPDEVYVTLKVRDVATGRVHAAYDYRIPMSGEIREMLREREDKGERLLFF